MQRILISFSLLIVLFSSCKKDSTPTYNVGVKAPLSVEFDNVAGTNDLKLNNTSYYVTSNGDSIKVSTLKYYVSNFSFTNVDGSVYTVPQDSSYHLIIEGDSSTYEPEFNIPEGEYKSVSFLLGVDSLHNSSLAVPHIGDLNIDSATNQGMLWTWNTGYIFYKLEGTSPQVVSMMGGKDFYFHIGLTTSAIKNAKTVTLDLSQRGNPRVKAGKTPNIHLFVDVLKTFSGNATVKLSENSMVMANPYSATVANNLPGIFSHAHTEN